MLAVEPSTDKPPGKRRPPAGVLAGDGASGAEGAAACGVDAGEANVKLATLATLPLPAGLGLELGLWVLEVPAAVRCSSRSASRCCCC